jgi:hypothetical protein
MTGGQRGLGGLEQGTQVIGQRRMVREAIRNGFARLQASEAIVERVEQPRFA